MIQTVIQRECKKIINTIFIKLFCQENSFKFNPCCKQSLLFNLHSKTIGFDKLISNLVFPSSPKIHSETLSMTKKGHLEK